MRYLLAISCFFVCLTTSAQVVDSLNAKTTLFALGTCDGPTRLVNVGAYGFILYGGERTAATSGLAAMLTTENFQIYHYDSLLKETITTIKLPFKVLDVYPQVKESVVYFLVMPQRAGSKKAALVTYNLGDRTYVTSIIHDDWMLRRGLEFSVCNNYLYMMYEEGELQRQAYTPNSSSMSGLPQTGDVIGESYQSHIEAFNLNEKEIKPLKLTLSEVPDYWLTGVRLVHTRNACDTVFMQLFYKRKKKAKTQGADRISRVEGFHNGRMIMSGAINNAAFVLNNPYAITCGDRVNFFEINRPEEQMGGRYSYLQPNAFVVSEMGANAANCYPMLPGSIWSGAYPFSDNYSLVHFSKLDSLERVKDGTLHVVRFIENRRVLDTSFLAYRENESTMTPLPNSIVINESVPNKLQFVVSSWQMLYSYEVVNNRVTQKYSIHLPLHSQLGASYTPLSYNDELSARMIRTDLESTMKVQYAYADFYYVYSLTMDKNSKAIQLRLYKCRF